MLVQIQGQRSVLLLVEATDYEIKMADMSICYPPSDKCFKAVSDSLSRSDHLMFHHFGFSHWVVRRKGAGTI